MTAKPKQKAPSQQQTDRATIREVLDMMRAGGASEEEIAQMERELKDIFTKAEL